MAHNANQIVVVRSIKGNLVCGEMALDERMGWDVMHDVRELPTRENKGTGSASFTLPWIAVEESFPQHVKRTSAGNLLRIQYVLTRSTYRSPNRGILLPVPQLSVSKELMNLTLVV